MEWIPVTERLPKKHDMVITYSQRDNSVSFSVIEGQFVRVFTDITHWMPLPPPPENDDE